MKKAFTLLELVFVIVIIGVLATYIVPSTRTNPVEEAAIQLVNHIRYTQYLGMIDDKYGVESKWYEERWQIRFTEGSEGSDNQIAYAIFSDFNGVHSTHPEYNELAKDPLTRDVITGGVTNGVHYDDEGVYSKANLGVYYGINSISFSSSCQYYGSMRIAFDHLGRPIRGNIGSTSVNTNLDTLKYITDRCDITISNGSESVVIAIEAETGFTHIL